MRLLFIVAFAVSLLACEEAPTPEYAKAKAAYTAAFADTADVTYKGARWDEVLTLLKAVPPSNGKERRLAQQLVIDIESTRARIAADLRASDANAEKLLDIKSLPPLEPIAPPVAAKPSERERVAAMNTCAESCKASFMSCMKSAGCTGRATSEKDNRTRAQFDCSGDATQKGIACNDAVNACTQKCNPPRSP